MTEDIITVSDLTVSYDELTVIRDAEMSAGDGNVVAIVGANGAGKTTLLKTVAGVKSPDSGSITFAGDDIIGAEPHDLVKRGLTYVPERHRIFPEMTVRDNLKTSLIPMEASNKHNYDRIFDLFPILEERQEQEAGTLSGGQQQMLAIAQGLIVNPDVLLLDEPTLGLAPKLVEDIRDTILEISSEGTTVLLVDEEIAMAAEVADEMYLMRQGSLRYLGEDEDFREIYNQILEETLS